MEDGVGPGIVKKILYPGTGKELEFTSGSKVVSDAEGERGFRPCGYRYDMVTILFYSIQATFHFKTFTQRKGEERKEVDCSRKLGQPFELLVGKKFKLEVWEELVKTMRVGEISEFVVHESVRNQ